MKYLKDKFNQKYTELTRDEILESIDNYNEKTFLPFCEIFDIPYIKKEWEALRKKHPGQPIFGLYLSKMKLTSFKSYGYKDSAKFNK